MWFSVWPLWWRVSLSIKLYTMLNHIRFVFTTISKIRNCLDNWTHRLGFESARAVLCKWAACMRQTLSKTFANSLNMQKQLEKMLGKRVLVVDKSTYHEKPHFDLFFTAISTSKKMFFIQSASWKRHCVTHWREQRGRDSYLPRQISQSDCEISSNCGKIYHAKPHSIC